MHKLIECPEHGTTTLGARVVREAYDGNVMGCGHEVTWMAGIGVVVVPPDEEEPEGPTCSICDALGHGYPGGGPCPLEVTDYSGEPDWAM